MPINSNQEKLDKFNVAIQHYALEQQKKIQQEIEAFQKKELEQAEDEVLQEAYGMIQKEMAEMRNHISREMAQRETEERRQLLEKRQSIAEDVFHRVAEKLLQYTKSEEYPLLLEKYAREAGRFLISHGAESCDCVMLLRKEDMPFAAQIQEALGLSCTVEEEDSIQLGGLRVLCPEKKLEADSTLDTLLEEQKGWFEENSGLSVH